MEDKQVVHTYYDLTPLAVVALVVMACIGVGLWLFFKAVEAGNQTAIAIIFVLWSLIMFVAGVLTAIKIIDHVFRHERQRETQQQSAFRDNAKENMGLLLSMAQVQHAQARAGQVQNQDAWRVAREATRMLQSGSGEVVDTDTARFDFDATDFTDLD